jgi:hypothetical protein
VALFAVAAVHRQMVVAILMVILLLLLMFKKGETPKWQWGNKD